MGRGGESVTEQNLVPNLVRLFAAAKQAGICVAISPHYYFPHDHKWKVLGPAEMFQHAVGMFDRPGALTLDGFRDSGADFMPELKPYIEDGDTIICSTHKLYGPQANDLVLQLRKQRWIRSSSPAWQPTCASSPICATCWSMASRWRWCAMP